MKLRLAAWLFLGLLFMPIALPTQSSSVQAQTGNGWTKLGSNPVLTVGPRGSWDCEGTAYPCVIKEGSIYKMWYAGFNGSRWSIGYAMSSNGISWSKHAYNPVLCAGSPSGWDECDVRNPWVVGDDSGYKMWYVGRDRNGRSRVGLAVSTDGIRWTKIGLNPVLLEGASGQPDSLGVHRLCVIKDGFG